jgi:SAM-dependent methyltransferase
MDLTYEDPTLTAYESLAPFYNSYTSSYGHEAWLANVEKIALSHGLRGNRVLDVGCGTGKSFLPMLERGYEVTACDISPAMVERAREVAGDETRVVVADARELPVLGRFDLVTSIDDALNYLLSEQELATAFEGIARNLRPGGLFAFDLNTLSCYRNYFLRDMAVEVDGAFFCWRGEAEPADVEPGALLAASIEVFSSDGGDCWRRSSSRHVQRHHPPEVVERLLSDAGFALVERRGQIVGAQMDPVGDEETHMKLDYFARRLPTPLATSSDQPDCWIGGEAT